MPVLTMSDTELTRFEVLRDVDHGRMPIARAAAILELGERQVWRLLKAVRLRGAEGLISKKRGQPSNRKLPDYFRRTILGIVREQYADFGPTLAAEKLRERHGMDISRETLRAWMIGDGLWLDRRQRRARIHQPRNRRECLGELVQIDGSKHWWFEDRGPQCTLLVYIDDATSRLMHLRFVPTESAFDYFQSTRAYIEAHGKPVAFYSDKHSIFRVNQVGGVKGDGMTQFGRALHQLNIDILCANTPQAKGRVERANKTLQDRLVKELRLMGINTIDAANAMLPTFVADYNARFGKEPRNPKDLHRPLAKADDLTEAFAWREDRTVSAALTLQYDRVIFMLKPSAITRDLPKKRVTVVDFPDGRLAIRHKGVDLPYSIFDQCQQVQQAAIVENKRLGAVLESIRERQLAQPEKRSGHAPRRRGQSQNMFSAR